MSKTNMKEKRWIWEKKKNGRIFQHLSLWHFLSIIIISSRTRFLSFFFNENHSSHRNYHCAELDSHRPKKFRCFRVTKKPSELLHNSFASIRSIKLRFFDLWFSMINNKTSTLIIRLRYLIRLWLIGEAWLICVGFIYKLNIVLSSIEKQPLLSFSFVLQWHSLTLQLVHYFNF